MRFPNAQAGVQKLYVAQILELISAICLIVTGIGLLGSVAAIASGSTDGGFVVGGLSLVFTIAAGILSIIAFIIMIVGLVKAQKDDNNFRNALFCVLGSIVFAVVAAFLTASPVAASIFTLLSGVATFLVTLFSINGIQSVAIKLGDSAIASRAKGLMTLILCIFGVSVILNFVSGLLKSGTGFTISGIFAILAGIAQIVAFFLYLGLLKKAKEAFKA